jgi:hypothetical protein
VRKVLQVLDADAGSAIAVKSVNVTTSTIRSQRTRALMYSIAKGRGPLARSTKATLKTLTTRRIRRGAARAVRRHIVVADAPAPDESFMLELRQRFRPQVQALSDYLERDMIGLWGYDRLGD